MSDRVQEAPLPRLKCECRYASVMAPSPKKPSVPTSAVAKSRAGANDAYEVVFFKKADGSFPGRAFLATCPDSVKAKFRAVIIAVATAPPHRFSGGGYWEAMHGEMANWFEVRLDGPKRHHYRWFCLLDDKAIGANRPYLVIIDGRAKPFLRTFSSADYAQIRELGAEYFGSNPRSTG